MEITEIEGDIASCKLDDVLVKASLSLVPQAKVGDWAIVHAGFAIELLDEKEARKTIELFEEIEEAYRGKVKERSSPESA
jgi:hydrogenase expression/formation protein HypC